MPNQEYFPSLADLIKADAIPGDFQALEDLAQNGIDLALKKIWYKDYVAEISSTGEISYYSLVLLTKQLKIPIPGTGINVVAFHGVTTNVSEFPVVLEWSWPAYKFISELIEAGFSGSPEEFVSVLLDLAEIDDERDFIGAIIESFLNDGNTSYQDFFTAFIAKINTYDTAVTGVTSEISNIVTQLNAIESEITSILDGTNQLNVLDLFNDYESIAAIDSAVTSIIDSINTLDEDYVIEINLFEDIILSALAFFGSDGDKFERLADVFRNLIPDIDLDELNSFLIPQFSAELNDIDIALEFPRTWLVPMVESPPSSGKYIEDSDPNNLSALVFTVGDLKYSTKIGFTFENTSSFSFQKSLIAGTGFSLEMANAKIDLWEGRNIEEADADGRPNTFKGVYIEQLEIGLPESLTPEPGETSFIEGTNLLIGSDGGFSGALTLKGTGPNPTLRAEIASLILELTKFDINFHQNSVTTFDIKADVYIPGVKATTAGTDSAGNAYGIGDDAPVGLDITYTAPDYSISVISSPAIEIFGTELIIRDLSFGFNSGGIQSLVFIGDLFIPQLKSNGAHTNAYETFADGAAVPITLSASYSSVGPNTYAFSATNIPAINILGLELDIASCTLDVVDGDLSGLNIGGSMLIPGVNDTSTGSQAELAIVFTYLEPDYTIEVTTFPTLTIFNTELLVDELKVKFNKNEISSFDFKGELYIPNLKAKGDGSNPKGDYFDGDSAPIYFLTSYEEVGSDKIFSVEADNIPVVSILGLDIDIRSLEFDILNGSLSGFAVESFLFIPGVTAETGGSYGSESPTSYIAGDLAPIGVTFEYDGTKYEIEFTSVPAIKMFGAELSILDLKLHFDDGGVDLFNLDADIRIPSFIAPDSLDGTTNANSTPIVGGSPYPIALSVDYAEVATEDVFTFSAGPFPAFEFFGMEIAIAPFSFTVTDGSLSALQFSADVDLNMGGTIGVDFTYDNGEYEVKMSGGPITLTLGSVDFTFNEFEIAWDEGGITGSTITGTMLINGTLIAFTMGFTLDGWEISATGTVGFTIPNVLGVTFHELTIGKRSGNFFVEVGNEGNVGTTTLGAELENLLSIPLVGKYLPSKLDIGFLAFEQGSGLNLSDAQLKLIWPELEGLEIASDGSGLEATIPVNKTIFKTITINTITVSMSNQDVNNDGDDETVLKALMDGSLEIGPVLGTVSGIGLEATISYPSSGGNLGAVNIDDFGIAGPDGIGLSIDSGGVKGGGYLSFNKDKGEYTGYLGLTINQKISLNAIAILNTKMPDGSSGISLLVILTVEFNPGIQLGFGFNLSGLGGLLGLNRTMEVEPLRMGVKDGTIDHILFPDPTTFVQNASTHISNIQSIFPMDQGRFVFGPMAKIGWGTPSLITAEVGLLLEVPKPIRLAILGVIKAVLPDEENDLIRLQINFLGLIDFGKKFISFDATIFDSKILTFAVSGDMAFRLHYGDNPAFLLSVGGFHPSFVSPIPVPSMERLTVKIVDKSKFKIVLTSYFAITSNTVQFGAKIDLLAKIGSIKAEGYFSLDTLFQFSPFYMIASISAGVAISYKSFDLAAIHLRGEIEGPTPWKVRGKATFKIIGIEKSFNMSETFGEERTVTYESIDVESLVVEAIDDDTNWMVTTGKLQDEYVVMKSHPNASNIINASGELTISQRVVPFNYTIEKYGNRVPSGAKNFSIASVAFGPGASEMADLENVKEDFASAEYKNIDQSKKLSIPSFEKMDGGVKVRPPAGGLDFGGDHTSATTNQREAEYEQTLIDYVPDPVDPMIMVVNKQTSSYSLRENWMQREVRGGAAARSKASRTRSKLYGKTDQRVSITEESFAVVSTDDLSTTYTAKTRLEAEALMEAEINADPTLEGKLQVITNHRV